MTEKSVQNLVTHCLPKFRLSQIKTLAWVVLGCLKNPRGLITEIARGCQGATTLRHKLKRIHRFLSNSRIDIEEHAQNLLNWLIARQGKLFVPLIAVDWTEEHGMKVLSFSFVWGRRSIPFYWHARKKGTLSRSQNSLESNAIRLLKSWMGGHRFILLADRGFHRTALVRALGEKYGIEYVIRVMTTTHVKVKGHKGALGKLRVHTNKVRDFKKALYGDSAKVSVRLVVKKIKVKRQAKNKGKPDYSTWYLVTSLQNENKHQIVEYYERRYGIEASYRDWKTALGWRHQPHIINPERLSRYLLVLTVGMICALVVAESKKGQRKKYLVVLQTSYDNPQTASLVQCGIWLIQSLSDRDTSLHIQKLFRIWGL